MPGGFHSPALANSGINLVMFSEQMKQLPVR